MYDLLKHSVVILHFCHTAQSQCTLLSQSNAWTCHIITSNSLLQTDTIMTHHSYNTPQLFNQKRDHLYYNATSSSPYLQCYRPYTLITHYSHNALLPSQLNAITSECIDYSITMALSPRCIVIMHSSFPIKCTTMPSVTHYEHQSQSQCIQGWLFHQLHGRRSGVRIPPRTKLIGVSDLIKILN